MPKRTFNISDFSGGINESSNARDIKDNEFVALTNVMVDYGGKIRIMGGENGTTDMPSAITANSPALPNHGYGLFAFSDDRNTSSTLTRNHVVAIFNNGDYDGSGGAGDIILYESSLSAWTQATYQATTNNTPMFYVGDGVIRACGDHDYSVMWMGYVRLSLFQDSSGNARRDIEHYAVNYSGNLDTLDEHNVTLALDDSSSENPNGTAIGTTAGKITLAYWRGEQGGWKGTYRFGISPVYVGGQESGISEVPGEIGMANEKLMLQVYITHGFKSTEPTTPAAGTSADDRIIGYNIYWRETGNEMWFLLDYVDVLDGGEETWEWYNDTDKAKGIYSGTFSIEASQPASLVAGATTTFSANVAGQTTNDIQGKPVILKVEGFFLDPVYKTVDSLGEDTTIQADVVNPAVTGDYHFKATLMDKNYFPISTATQSAKTITSGANPAEQSQKYERRVFEAPEKSDPGGGGSGGHSPGGQGAGGNDESGAHVNDWIDVIAK